jgi:hypothetical protein
VLVLAGFVAGAVLGAVLWRLSAPAFAHEVFARQNFRGRTLPTAVGVLTAVAAVIVDAVVAVVVAAGADPADGLVAGLRVVTLAALGFAALGLLDDLGGAGESGGFSGHLKALVGGKLTTGAIKLFGGAAVAVVAVASVEPEDLGRLLLDAALVALAANLGNLFDRAPARTTKVAVLAFVVLVVAAGAEPALTGVAAVIGAGVGLAHPDLRERLMLGDAGANVLGAALGLGVVLACSPGVRTGVLVVVALLNLASERISFTKVINATPPLRALDRLGREP